MSLSDYTEDLTPTPPAASAGLSTYLDDLGVKKPKAKAGPGRDVAGPPLAPGGPFLSLPETQQNAIIRDARAGGDGSGRAPTFNGVPLDATAPAASASGAGRGSVNPPLASQPQPTRGGFVPGTFDNTPHVPSDHGAYVPPDPSESWWDKARGGLEATAGTVLSVPAGVIGMLSHPGDSKAAGEVTGGVVNGAMKYLGMPPMSPTGQRYMGNVGDTIAPVADSLMGVGPMSEFAHGLGAVGDVAAGVKANVLGRGATAAARTEPTLAESASTAIRPANAPTLAQASPQLQKAVADAGLPADHPAVLRHVDADTLPVPVKITTGQAAGNPTMISDEMNGRGKGQAAPVSPEFYQAQGRAIAQSMDAIRAKAAPDVPLTSSAVDHGQALLDSLKTEGQDAAQRTTALYKQLSDANGGSLPVNGQDFVTAADAALSKQMKGRYVPPQIAADMEDLRSGGPMTFENFENMRTNLAAEGRKAERAGDGNAAGAISIVRSALEDLPMSGEAANIKPIADAARQSAREEFARQKSNPAYKAAVNDSVPAGEPSPLADNFFHNYVIKGKAANVSDLSDMLAHDPTATQTIAAGVLDHLKAQLKADPESGKFSSDGLSRALKPMTEGQNPKIAALLDDETTQQMQQLSRVANATQVQPRGAYVNNSNSMVALAADAAKNALTHGANIAAHGIPVGSVARAIGSRVMDARAANQAVRQSTDVGAGLMKLSDLAK